MVILPFGVKDRIVVANAMGGKLVARTWAGGCAALLADHRPLRAGQGDAEFYRAKIATARFFVEHFMSQASGLRDAITQGAASVMALNEAQF